MSLSRQQALRARERLATQPSPVLGIALMVAAALSFSLMSALIKVASARIPTMQIVLFRGLIGVCGIALFELVRYGRLRPAGARGRLLARSISGFLALAAYVWAIAHVHLGVASALNQSSPLFVTLFALLFLGERPSLAVVALVVVAFVGVLLVVAPDFAAIDPNALVGLSSGVLAAVAYVLVRALRGSDPPFVIVRWFSAACALGAFPFALWQGVVWPLPMEFAVLSGVAVCSLLGQFGMTYAYRMTEASVVAPFMYTSVVASLLIGGVIWSEWPGVGALAGVALIVASSVGIAVLRRD
jgi:drug/metabolite transporter (DMT)-like permease